MQRKTRKIVGINVEIKTFSCFRERKKNGCRAFMGCDGVEISMKHFSHFYSQLICQHHRTDTHTLPNGTYIIMPIISKRVRRFGCARSENARVRRSLNITECRTFMRFRKCLHNELVNVCLSHNSLRRQSARANMMPNGSNNINNNDGKKV